MPRGKRISTAELMTRLEDKIAVKEADLAKLKSSFRQLKKQRNKEAAQELMGVIEAQGISLEDAINKIRS